MSNLILLSVVLITLALVLYSVAVWLNRRSRRLTVANIVIFWCAVAADTLATRLMGARVETIRWDLHTISGYLALALMAALTLWGTVALLRRRDDWIATFHKLALPIWVIWVGSYITGVYLGVQRVSGS
ncbi:MAG: TIGR03987 family protein [Gammaproteobacteria bacterium]|nr:TIGR03987 family protein [Gammaproteobacteria bacterium]